MSKKNAELHDNSSPDDERDETSVRESMDEFEVLKSESISVTDVGPRQDVGH